MSSAQAGASDNGPAIYTCGTLRYTKAGLLVLFSWLLWGDFCFTLFETIGGPGILGLYLQDNFRVSNKTVNIMFNIIPQLIGVIVGPVLSFKSDRHRGRWGRRIPYMIWTTPFLCFFAAAIGYSDEIMSFVKNHVQPGSFVSPMTAAMILISFLVIGFSFFNEFVNTVYWYLFADVVPPAFMGRFLGLFRLVGAAAGFLFNVSIAGYQLTHMRAIHVGVAVLYFVGFTLMCLFVKEGEYPPVTDVTEKTTFLDQVKIYFRECFTHKIYILIYLSTMIWAFSRSAPMAGVFGLHLSQHEAMSEPGGGSMNAVSMASDGRVILTARQDGRVEMWDGVKDRKLLSVRTLAPSGPAATSGILTPDGQVAVAGTAEGEIRGWRTSDGQPTGTMKGHQGAVLGLAVSPDGKRLASAGADHAVRVWDLGSGQCLRTIAEHRDSVRSVAFSSDGSRIVSGGLDKKIIVVDVASGEVLRTIENPGPVYAVCFIPSLVKPGGRPSTPVIPSATGPAATAPVQSVSPAADFQPGPAGPNQPHGLKRFVNLIKAVPGRIAGYLKEVFTNESLYDKPVDERSRIVAQDAWLLVGGQDDGDDSRNAGLRIWDVQTGALVCTLKGHKQAITSVQYKPDLHMVLSGSLDSSFRLWDPVDISLTANDQSVRAFSGYTLGVTALSSAADGPRLATASTAGRVHLWNMDKGVSLFKSGYMASFFGIVGLVLTYPFGWLVDRYHPLRITVFASLVLMPIPFISYFVVYDYVHLVYLEIPKVFFFGIVGAASMPFLIALLPKEKFGQMCSANGLVKQLSLAVLGYVGAAFMDYVTDNTLLTDNFRYAFLWSGVGFVLYQVTLLAIYWEWKKLGGDAGYIPPGSAPDEEKPVPAVQATEPEATPAG
jgi:WD40 repeat protein